MSELVAVQAELHAQFEQRKRLHADRRTLARRIVADPKLMVLAMKAHLKPARLDRWAAPAKPFTCPRGHPRVQYGQKKGRQWICSECPPEEKPAVSRSRRERRDDATIRAAWAKHAERLAERERLAALDQLPVRLKEDLPPPRRLG